MRVLFVSVALVLMLGACAPDDSTPEGAAKLFVRAVAMRDGPRMFELLAPDAQAKLKKMAELATAQTSGRRRFTAPELLAAGLDQPRYRLSRVQLAKVEGDRATVELLSAAEKERESLVMLRIDGRWRIVLPKGAMTVKRAARSPERPPQSGPAPTSAPSAPSTAPASAPASTTP